MLVTNHPSCLSSKYKEDSWHLLDSFSYSIQSEIYFSQQKRQTRAVTLIIHPAACTKTTDIPVCLYSEAGLHTVQSELNVLQLKKMYANRRNNCKQRKWCIELSQPLYVSKLLDM